MARIADPCKHQLPTIDKVQTTPHLPQPSGPVSSRTTNLAAGRQAPLRPRASSKAALRDLAYLPGPCLSLSTIAPLFMASKRLMISHEILKLRTY